ncbi:tigger transposable element-derived protein 4-like [Dunckerocampus dactyliophorus]|uniref:tigger transposable element-derived protein 4-like n=1 Tax=Dunckerocampus dactyliophorus TaxID=161453 RepID=UPI0024062980|nr:tigger transposable element-derived protein 4-like [Dunckerocampus dactyliophorus]
MSEHGQKRKLELHTLDIKYRAVKAVEGGTARSTVQEQFNVKRNTLSGWIKHATKIKEQYESGSANFNSKKMKLPKNPDVEKALYLWYCDVRKKHPTFPIRRDLLSQKAEQFARDLGVGNFIPSNGWFTRFKQRYNLTYKRVCGEGKDNGLSQPGEWKERLAKILSDYQPRDIYNADETALFLKCTPDYTNTTNGESGVEGKQPKDRVTLMVTANMDGSDKVPLFLIGKFNKPFCLKHVERLPLKYNHSKKAWMTPALFTTWIQQLDRQMVIQQRKIVLIVDNCSAHPHVEGLQAIKLVFLPPNYTSATQPMNRGIIRTLKFHYRKMLTKKKLSFLEANGTFREDLLGAMYSLRKAWDAVKPETIRSCFFRAFTADGKDDVKVFEGFQPDDIMEDDEDDKPFYSAIGLDREGFKDRCNPQEEDLECSAPCTDKDILQSVASKSDDTVDAGNEEDVPPTNSPPPTMKDALQAAEVLRTFAMISGDEELLRNIEDVSARARPPYQVDALLGVGHCSLSPPGKHLPSFC